MNTHQDLDFAELESLMAGYWLTDFSNFCGFFYEKFPNINWIGFYLNDGVKLRLGPFQGKPACTEILFGRGVCGFAVEKKEIQVVDDVHAFEGHISCDSRSRSELVLPLIVDMKVVGVLDVDSPMKARFTNIDVELFSEAVKIL